MPLFSVPKPQNMSNYLENNNNNLQTPFCRGKQKMGLNEQRERHNGALWSPGGASIVPVSRVENADGNQPHQPHSLQVSLCKSGDFH